MFRNRQDLELITCWASLDGLCRVLGTVTWLTAGAREAARGSHSYSKVPLAQRCCAVHRARWGDSRPASSYASQCSV